MTNTIPNVPSELLERVLNAGWGSEAVDALDDLRDFLESAPSPDGGGGMEVVAYEHVLHMELGQKECFFSEIEELPFGVKGEDFSATYAVTSEPLCRLSDAKAIIDGLRGENEALHAQVKVLQSDANSWQSGYDEGRRMGGKHCGLTIDQQAQRIGELEWLLRGSRKHVAYAADHCEQAGMELDRIDAALFAGKDGE